MALPAASKCPHTTLGYAGGCRGVAISWQMQLTISNPTRQFLQVHLEIGFILPKHSGSTAWRETQRRWQRWA